MDYEIEVKEIEPQHMVSIRQKCQAAEIGGVLSQIIPEVLDYLRKNSVQASGPPFTRYHGFADNKVELEAGIPVSEKMAGQGRIKAGELPGGRVATTIHVGPYEQLPQAHDALHQWIDSNKEKSRGAQWESYVSVPGKQPNPSKQKTELIWPID